ncbi:hypothetical protein FEM48_Zijuj10G0097200 [Ziziphus jujuba var. spinosa]|uniref:At1g68980-like TPR repeats domain-containing protein n=1 Tax=Ziziphus jujuba var. spinosa TaxID=714518 RepID=A0A978UMN1_ZIZJJ|nr:hypothetical protein FEM48_Zijuj10G0097200 [Ziziphus jujuba var. spinosa]
MNNLIIVYRYKAPVSGGIKQRWMVWFRRMWKKTFSWLPIRRFSSTPEIPTLYSFLQHSIYALKRDPSSSSSPPTTKLPTSTPKTLTQDHITSVDTTIQNSVLTNHTDEAWKSFKILTGSSAFPSKSTTNFLIAHLSSLKDVHNLKRAFPSVIYVVEKNPGLLDSFNCANTAAPAFALIKCMFKNRFFLPFSVWGNVLVEISGKNGNFSAFLRVFEENCRIALDEKLDFMKPDLVACNAAPEGCCRQLESVDDSEKVVETMSVLGVRPDQLSFGYLAYLYALKGLEEKISELENLMVGFEFSEERVFQSEETYCEVVKGFLPNGGIKALATLVIKAQKLEPSTVVVDKSVGFGIISACINLGLLDKAHSILDEMNAQEGFLGLVVYVPILKAYCKEHRTAEATQLVMDISNSGLQLDVGMYDSLIDASMSGQDFQSAFSLFRDMRDARLSDLKGSYLTIMTGLMENHRPELMAAFLDDVVEDPRVEVGTHDWNSIIHAFCKAGRLEDARRTFRRMIFLQFKPNEQTYLSLISGYVLAEKYFSVLMLWNEVKRNLSVDGEKGLKFDQNLVDAFLYALVKGGFFDAAMQVVEKSQEMKIFVDKWRYKQGFMETHKSLKWQC